ncbi:MAG: hypothetical protein ACLPID_21125 [Beijerinckiaceae bacterium]
MKAQDSLDAAAFAEWLRRLANQQPTRKSIEALLREHAPLLARIFRAGWRDEDLVEAFQLSNEVGATDRDLEAFRSLLREAHNREQATKPRKTKAAGSRRNKSVPLVGEMPVQKERSAPPRSDIPINDGID